MKKYILIFSSMLLSVPFIKAQTNDVNLNYITIIGRVIHHESKETLPMATIQVRTKDTTIATHMANMDGSFSIQFKKVLLSDTNITLIVKEYNHYAMVNTYQNIAEKNVLSLCKTGIRMVCGPRIVPPRSNHISGNYTFTREDFEHLPLR